MPENRVAVSIESVTLTEEAGIKTYFVTLQDAAERTMRIYIGKQEALALSVGLQGHAPDRPQTYDAMLACIAATGSVVEEVCISDLRDETFYATAVLRVGHHSREVDLRPSDALNLAVRTRCPLLVGAAVFEARLAPVQSAEAPAEAAIQTITVTPPAEVQTLSAAEVSDELVRLFTEDQSDRHAETIDWEEVGPRDVARLARVKQLYRGQKLQSGLDYYHAAMVLQHSSQGDDYLLAHEFCIAAIAQGVEPAKWLAAASEDRFLTNSGRLQRFGTQYQVDGSSGRWSLQEVSPEVEDSLRSALNVPSLLSARVYAEEMNAKPL